MEPDRERLVLDAAPLVERAASAFVRRLPPHADGDAIRGAALEGLVLAASRFNGNPETWEGYCRRRVNGAMLDEARRLDPARNRSTTATRNRVEAATVELPETLAAPADEYGRARSRLDLVSAIRLLPARERYVVAATEILDRRGADVAAGLGVHETRVAHIRTDAFRKLRPRLA